MEQQQQQESKNIRGRTRARKVTDPLREEVRATLCGACLCQYQCLPSNNDDEDESVCFHDFMCGATPFREHHQIFSKDEQPSLDDHVSDDPCHCDVKSALQVLLNQTNRFEPRIRDIVEEQYHNTGERSLWKVVRRMQGMGYDAGVCRSKSKKKKHGDLGCCEYEYIDVMDGDRGERYIVDVDFRSKFETARPTSRYKGMVEALPRVFVGKEETVEKVLRLMCSAMRRSLTDEGMWVPPWRKHSHMHSMWLGPYSRYTDPVDVSAPKCEKNVHSSSRGSEWVPPKIGLRPTQNAQPILTRISALSLALQTIT